jgi:hypothetical protein
MMKPAAQISSGIVLISALAATAVFADPVTVMQGTVIARMGGGSFSLTGNGFSFTGGVPQGFSASSLFECEPCGPADRLPLDLNSFSSFHVEGGAATFQGVTYPSTNLFGVFTFASPFNAFSSANITASGGSPQEPFTFSGELLDYLTGSNGVSTPIFYAQLSGSGVAHANFTAVGTGQFAADAITYQFSAPAAVTPEPASLVLLASGLAGLVGFCRRTAGTARFKASLQ